MANGYPIAERTPGQPRRPHKVGARNKAPPPYEVRNFRLQAHVFGSCRAVVRTALLEGKVPIRHLRGVQIRGDYLTLRYRKKKEPQQHHHHYHQYQQLSQFRGLTKPASSITCCSPSHHPPRWHTRPGNYPIVERVPDRILDILTALALTPSVCSSRRGNGSQPCTHIRPTPQ